MAMRLVPDSDAPEAKVARAAAERALAAAPDRDRDDVALLLTPIRAGAIADALRGGGRMVVEAGEGVAGRIELAGTSLQQGAQAAVALITETVLDPEICVGIVDGMEALEPRVDRVRDYVRPALHEAIMNAVVHGNLELPGVRSPTREELDEYFARVSQRLGDPVYGRRTVLFAITPTASNIQIAVADQGQGFDPKILSPALEPSGPDGAIRLDAASGGRGFTLMHGYADLVAISRGGRMTALTFSFARGA